MGFNLLTILVVYLAWLVLPCLGYGQVRATGLTTAKDVSRTATERLRKLPDEKMDQQLPAAVRSPLKQYRGILKQATQAGKLNDAQLKRLVTESEESLTTLRTATQKNEVTEAPTAKVGLGNCFRDCESAHARCMRDRDPHDWLGGFICNLEAEGCSYICLLDAFAARGRPETR